MKYKLIALDIDGTLINSSNQITENVKLAIQKAKEKGHPPGCPVLPPSQSST